MITGKAVLVGTILCWAGGVIAGDVGALIGLFLGYTLMAEDQNQSRH